MFEKSKLKRGLKKKSKRFDNDYISQVLRANFGDDSHRMEVKDEKVFQEIFSRTFEELSPLEKADLIDYWEKEENGRTNKTRRNILRWS